MLLKEFFGLDTSGYSF